MAGVGAVLVLVGASLCVSIGAAAAVPPSGYWLLGGDGGIFSFQAPFHGSAASDPKRCPANTVDRMHPTGTCFALAATPDGGGYWILNGDTGDIWRYGNAVDYGEPATEWKTVPREFVPTGIAIVPSSAGYWVLSVGLSGAGTIDHFGNAGAYGDTSTLARTKHLAFNGTPVGMAVAKGATGYYEVHSDGGVFGFGSAKFFGSLGGQKLTSPIVGMAVTKTGNGYWLAAADGHVYPFGDAAAVTQLNHKLTKPVVGIATDPGSQGCWLVAADGGIFTFAGAPFLGSMGATRLSKPVFGIAARPSVT
jgi:hypothetical protein